VRRKAAWLGVLAVLATGVLLSANPAAAHTSLVGSTPEDGAVLAEAPDEIVLEFDEAVQPGFSQVAVLDAEETHYEDGDPESDGATVTQAVSELPAGDYRVSYRIGSVDGHPVTGVIAFTVETVDGDSTGDEPATDGDGTGEAAEVGGSEDDAAEDEDGAPVATVVATMAAIAAVGIAGVLLLRRRPGSPDDDVPPDEQ
jgi:methionine-rich copper-binding protein CopC